MKIWLYVWLIIALFVGSVAQATELNDLTNKSSSVTSAWFVVCDDGADTSTSTGRCSMASLLGLLPLAFGTQIQNYVLAAPSGASGAPTFRALVEADIPTLNQNTTGTAANLSGSPTVPNGTAASTQTQGDNSTKLATTAYVDTGLSGKVSSSAAASYTEPSNNEPIVRTGSGTVGGATSLSDGTRGLLTGNNTSSYTCSSGTYGVNFVGGSPYFCSNGTNTAAGTGSGSASITTTTYSSNATMNASTFTSINPFNWTGGDLTLPTAAANMWRSFGVAFPSGSYSLIPAASADVITFNGTALTANHKLTCSTNGLYSIIGTGTNAWSVFGPASGCTDGGAVVTACAGTSTWYGNTTTDVAYEGGNGGYSSRTDDTNTPVIITTGGTICSIRVYAMSGGGTAGNIRLAVYDTSYNKLCEWDAEVAVTGGSLAYVARSYPNLSGTCTVTTGQHVILAWSVDANDTGVGSSGTSTSGNSYYTVNDYTGGFPATISASSAYNRSWVISVGVQ